MSAAAMIADCRRLGIELRASGSKLHVSAPAGTVGPALRASLAEHKAAILLALVAGAECDQTKSDPRSRIEVTSRQLGLQVAAVLAEFDGWQYPEADIAEMRAWPVEMIEAHARLLAAEAEQRQRDHDAQPTGSS